MKNKGIIFIVLVLSFSTLYSQGLYENELITNAVIIQKRNELSSDGKLRVGSVADTISFGVKGLLDDFTNDSPFPDTTLWMDDFVYINRDYPKAPISFGVATFDGLNEKGYPYNFQVASGSSGAADFLTSKPIDLTASVSDSVYLSFYFQPQGLGNAPESSDSLVLQFKSPDTTLWHNVWETKGFSLSAGDSSWNLVMIPIKDISYLKKGFQFRFRNYATLSGNVDHWHIDYVYLNKNRSITDTLFEDIAFVYNTPSMLNDYSTVPWRHYSSSMMKTNYTTTIRNNHTAIKNGSFGHKIYNEQGVQQGTTYSGGSFNIDPYNPFGYMNYAPFTSPPLGFNIPTLTDSTYFLIESFINSTPDFHRKNDTIRYKQKFNNSYAYDDGTAETSFGLSTLYGQIAEKFVIASPDTLQAIDIFWNPVLTDVSKLYTLNLMVWGDNAGKPGAVIFTDTTTTPNYTKTGQNQFTRHYLFKSKVYIPAGTYYFGFRQNTNQFLNIGVDRNVNTQLKVFYNVTGNWTNSPYQGSLMLHPVFGPTSDFVGVHEKPQITSSIAVYPNPVTDKLYLKGIQNHERYNVSIIDICGRTINYIPQLSSEVIEISDLSNGIYFIKIENSFQSYIQKIIVSK